MAISQSLFCLIFLSSSLKGLCRYFEAVLYSKKRSREGRKVLERVNLDYMESQISFHGSHELKAFTNTSERTSNSIDFRNLTSGTANIYNERHLISPL